MRLAPSEDRQRRRVAAAAAAAASDDMADRERGLIARAALTVSCPCPGTWLARQRSGGDQPWSQRRQENLRRRLTHYYPPDSQWHGLFRCSNRKIRYGANVGRYLQAATTARASSDVKASSGIFRASIVSACVEDHLAPHFDSVERRREGLLHKKKKKQRFAFPFDLGRNHLRRTSDKRLPVPVDASEENEEAAAAASEEDRPPRSPPPRIEEG
jgi:hypothetical protein